MAEGVSPTLILLKKKSNRLKPVGFLFGSIWMRLSDEEENKVRPKNGEYRVQSIDDIVITMESNETVRVQLLNWICSQPRFIQTLFRTLFGRLNSANCVPA